MDKSSALDLVNLENEYTSHEKHNVWCSCWWLDEFRTDVGNRRFAIEHQNKQLNGFFDQKR